MLKVSFEFLRKSRNRIEIWEQPKKIISTLFSLVSTLLSVCHPWNVLKSLRFTSVDHKTDPQSMFKGRISIFFWISNEDDFFLLVLLLFPGPLSFMIWISRYEAWKRSEKNFHHLIIVKRQDLRTVKEWNIWTFERAHKTIENLRFVILENCIWEKFRSFSLEKPFLKVSSCLYLNTRVRSEEWGKVNK